ncbi:MAG: hypothetical protein U0K57_07255 [Lachnospiraceae bacterium]|nr:hypothetical protein [Lachnospiraceae bacterium]
MVREMTEDLRRIILAGIGTATLVSERSRDLADMLVEKGEVTVQRGRVLNTELSRKKPKKSKRDTERKGDPFDFGQIDETVKHMSPGQIARLREALNEYNGE